MPHRWCVPCNRSFRNEHSLQQHLNSPAHNFECDYCDRSFRSEQSLQQHLTSPAHVFKCEPCDRSFRNEQSLQQHLTSPAHVFECESCDRFFGSEQSLQQHLTSPAHVFKCESCDRFFGSEQSLQQHLNSPAHVFKCESCDQSFRSEQSLQQHLNSPAHVFECKPCDQSFRSEQSLQQHLDSPAHVFECESCDQSFGSEQSLQQHLNSPAHVFKCESCDQSFGNNQSLLQHLISSVHAPIPKCDTINHYYNPCKVVHDFIIKRTTTFKDLINVRQKGWDNPKGDTFFKKQRENADKSDSIAKQFFFKMMQGIGNEMNERTGAFSNFVHGNESPKFLDLCMAPGGFSHFLLQLNPTAQVCGVSLPPSKGGHKLFLDLQDSRVTVKFMDITFLYTEMLDSANTVIPSDHPDAGNFIETRPYLSDVFDLVICDGQVLRTHKRAEYREPVEAKRLLVSQLVLGLQRIRAGGTVVVLLHKLETWRNLELLYMFSKFSLVQLFKPEKSHAIRSSFYLIAKSVQPRNPHAIKAISTWKRSWLSTTFRSCPEDTVTEKEVLSVLSQFGEHYVRLGIPIWSIQKTALERSSFC